MPSDQSLGALHKFVCNSSSSEAATTGSDRHLPLTSVAIQLGSRWGYFCPLAWKLHLLFVFSVSWCNDHLLHNCAWTLCNIFLPEAKRQEGNEHCTEQGDGDHLPGQEEWGQEGILGKTYFFSKLFFKSHHHSKDLPMSDVRAVSIFPLSVLHDPCCCMYTFILSGLSWVQSFLIVPGMCPGVPGTLGCADGHCLRDSHETTESGCTCLLA